MAPEYKVVLSVLRTAAVAAQQDAELAHKAASFLAFSLPEKSRAQVVEELLARLRQEKAERESRGLNHWHEHGPRFLARIVVGERAEHRRAVAAFVAENHEHALEFAFHITRNWDQAERALGKTYVELLEGKTTVRFFFRALKLNARDVLRLYRIERERFDSVEYLRARQLAEAAGTEGEKREMESFDFPSHHKEDRDPEEILIEREELEAARKIAETDWRYRWIRQKEWGRTLDLNR